MIGKRIEQARKASGMSMRSLAEKAGISAMAISKYEREISKPSSSVLLALAKVLNVKVEYFFRPISAELQEVEYRKQTRLSKKDLGKIQGDVLDQIERYLELEQLLPQLPMSQFEIPRSLPKKVTSYDEIEDLAESLRDAWELGSNPVPDLMNTLEERGIRVFISELDESQQFDGLAAKVNGNPVIVVSKYWPSDRQRFTLAHELGHLIVKDRLETSLDEEKAANRFAGAFLAPKAEVISRLGLERKRLEPYELGCLKKEYGLSMSGWVYRAFDLHIINQSSFKNMMKFFSMRGWLREEPYPSCIKEYPALFEQMVFRALGQDIINESKAAELLRKPLPEFRRLRAVENDHAAAD